MKQQFLKKILFLFGFYGKFSVSPVLFVLVFRIEERNL